MVGEGPFKYKGWKFDQKVVTPSIWIKRPDTHLNKMGPYYIVINGVMGRPINGQQSQSRPLGLGKGKTPDQTMKLWFWKGVYFRNVRIEEARTICSSVKNRILLTSRRYEVIESFRTPG